MEVALKIIEGHASSTQISSAAKNYDSGDYLRAGGDIIAALDAIGSMAGHGIPYTKAIQAIAIGEAARYELSNHGHISDNTIQDLLGLGL